MDQIEKDFLDYPLDKQEYTLCHLIIEDLVDVRSTGCPSRHCDLCTVLVPERVDEDGNCPCDTEVPTEILIERLGLMMELHKERLYGH